jgi:hypothetical protein
MELVLHWEAASWIDGGAGESTRTRGDNGSSVSERVGKSRRLPGGGSRRKRAPPRWIGIGWLVPGATVGME